MNQDPDPNVLLRIPNPFSSNIYSDAWKDVPTDVSQIHRGAFDTLWEAFKHVASMDGNGSILVQGPPGAGKTHLLGRLRRRLAQAVKEAPDRAVRAVFIYIQLSCNPDLIWQHIRRRLTDDLLQEVQGLSQLQRIVAHELAVSEQAEPGPWVRKLRILTQMGDPEVDRWLDDLVIRLQLPNQVGTVLGHLIHRRSVRDARAWLRGDFVPPQRLMDLGLNPDTDPGDAETESREVVTALVGLAPPTLPMILCFDQVEAIERFNQDNAALFRFGRVVADLFNEGRNLLLISCIQNAFLPRLEASAAKADYHRMSETESPLNPLNLEEAKALLQARMACLPALEELRAAHPAEPLWPLTHEQLETIPDGGWTARTLLARAKQWFDTRSTRSPTKPTANVEAFLESEFELRQERTVRPSTKEILLHGLPLICGLDGVSWGLDTNNLPRDVGLRLRRGSQTIDVVVLNQPDMRATWRPLKRLVERKDDSQIAIVREARLAIPTTGKKTIENLDKLMKQGAKMLWLRPEALSALQAARTLLSEARAGDLSIDGSTVTPKTVAGWLAKHLKDRLGPVTEVFEELESGGPPINKDLERLKEAVDRARIIELTVLAEQLELEPATVERLGRDHAAAIGLLDGPPVVFFAFRLRRATSLETRS